MNLCLQHRKVFSQEWPIVGTSSEKFVGKESLSQNFSRSWKSSARPKMNARNSMRQGDRRVCFYCLNPGHLISDYKELNRKNV